MELSPAEIRRAMEWLLPLGVCCAEAQADGVPCDELGNDCLECPHAEPVRRLLLRIARQIQHDQAA
ncbi:MAG: hypothetical protein ACOCUW_02465 [Gemmatimonadota bacterium]